MTVFIEVSGPWQWRPGWYHSGIITRAWWACFAAGIIWEPFREFTEDAHIWEGADD